MKKLLLTITVVSALISCQADKSPDLNVDELSQRKPVMEIFSHSQSIVQFEFISPDKHAAFLSDQLRSFIQENPLSEKMYKIKSEETDTLFSLDELPVFSELVNTTRIFDDGTSTSELIDLTPEDANPARTFSETPVSTENLIHKTIVENQQLIAYNKAGEILVSEFYPQEDLSDFLDTMKLYVQQIQNSSSLQKMKSLNTSIQMGMQNLNKSKTLSNGNIVIEQVNLNISTGQSDFSKFGVLKSITETDPGMSKILKFELYSGSQLLSRKIFTYADNVLLRNSVYKKDVYGENPYQIDLEMLVVGSHGQPMIKKSKQIFVRNQTFFHF